MRKAMKIVPHKKIVVVVNSMDGPHFIGKRPAEGMSSGLWEFPGDMVSSANHA